MSFVRAGGRQNVASTFFSTGIPSLDAIFGDGGLPAGCLLLLLEDKPRSSSNHASQIVRCWVAEGVCRGGQQVYFEGPEGLDSPLLRSLPPPVSDRAAEQPQSGETMSIAWRYKHLQIADTLPLNRPTGKNCIAYDLGGKPLDYEQTAISLLEEGVCCDQGSRLVVHGLGSAWLHHHGGSIERLLALKSLVVSTRSAALVTVPAYLLPEQTVQRLVRLADCCLQLHSFVDCGNPSLSSEYQGLVQLIKPLRLPGSLRLALPDTLDLAYRCKRRRFLLERFHLPPELGQGTGESGCSRIDF